jgi:hypothetical protein
MLTYADVCRLAAVFADEGFAQCGGAMQQQHSSGLLLRCLLHLGKEDLEASEALPCVLDAVQVRLNTSLIQPYRALLASY